jgi:hypothetical protein
MADGPRVSIKCKWFQVTADGLPAIGAFTFIAVAGFLGRYLGMW